MTPEEAFFFKKKNCLQIFFEFIFGAFSLKLLHGSKFYFVHISIFKFKKKKGVSEKWYKSEKKNKVKFDAMCSSSQKEYYYGFFKLLYYQEK
jgi:hypothetical protein